MRRSGKVGAAASTDTSGVPLAHLHPRCGTAMGPMAHGGMLVAGSTLRKSLHFEKLVGDRGGQHSIRLNDQWRLVLRLEARDDGRVVVILEIVDYH